VLVEMGYQMGQLVSLLLSETASILDILFGGNPLANLPDPHTVLDQIQDWIRPTYGQTDLDDAALEVDGCGGGQEGDVPDDAHPTPIRLPL